MLLQPLQVRRKKLLTQGQTLRFVSEAHYEKHMPLLCDAQRPNSADAEPERSGGVAVGWSALLYVVLPHTRRLIAFSPRILGAKASH